MFEVQFETSLSYYNRRREASARALWARTVANFNRVENTRVPKSEVQGVFSPLVISLGSPAMPQEISALKAHRFICFLGLENWDFWAIYGLYAQMLLISEVQGVFSLL